MTHVSEQGRDGDIPRRARRALELPADEAETPPAVPVTSPKHADFDPAADLFSPGQATARPTAQPPAGGWGPTDEAEDPNLSGETTTDAPAPEESQDSWWSGDDGDDDRLLPDQQPPRRRHGRVLRDVIAVLASIALLAGVGFFVYGKARTAYLATTDIDYQGAGVTDMLVTIQQGATLTDIGQTLVDRDVVKTVRAFKDEVAKEPRASSIQPGVYRLKTQMSARSALTGLLDPASRVQHSVTVPEGLRNSAVFQTISEATGLSVADLMNAAQNGAAIGLPSYANGNSEGYLFPDTYSYDQQADAVGLLKQMTGEFVSTGTDLQLESKAAALGISPHDVVTVASIIEKETRDPKYGPLIAEVIYNRLKKGMNLQMDSTVTYANNSPGTVTTTDEQRAIDSPYNTYLNPGLPPGAIANPGRNSLAAALNPAQGDYLYFVTVNLDTGETRFASTYEEHQTNVAAFQAWCQANANKCG